MLQALSFTLHLTTRCLLTRGAYLAIYNSGRCLSSVFIAFGTKQSVLDSQRCEYEAIWLVFIIYEGLWKACLACSELHCCLPYYLGGVLAWGWQSAGSVSRTSRAFVGAYQRSGPFCCDGLCKPENWGSIVKTNWFRWWMLWMCLPVSATSWYFLAIWGSASIRTSFCETWPVVQQSSTRSGIPVLVDWEI